MSVGHLEVAMRIRNFKLTPRTQSVVGRKLRKWGHPSESAQAKNRSLKRRNRPGGCRVVMLRKLKSLGDAFDVLAKIQKKERRAKEELKGCGSPKIKNENRGIGFFRKYSQNSKSSSALYERKECVGEQDSKLVVSTSLGYLIRLRK